MGVFVYDARTRTGESKAGEIEAESLNIATAKLRSQGLTPVKVKRKPIEINLRLPGSSGVSTKELVVFTRQFATMIDAGLPLVQCLELLASQATNGVFRKVLYETKATVESGKTLADAMRQHPKVFNRLYVNLVAAGEASGVLDTILQRLAAYIEKNMKLVKQVRGALIYPTIVLVVAILVTVILLVFVIPIFEKMFADMHAALPAPTQVVVDISLFVRSYIVYMIVGAIGAFYAFRAFAKTSAGETLIDKTLIQLPIIGPLLRKVAVAKFTRTMSTMLASGVNILEALDIVASTAGNVVIERGLLQVRAKISEGKPMAALLADMPIFPSMVVQMIAVGESTGAMDAMLAKIADFYDDEVDDAVGIMMAALEPLIMGLLAILLGGLVISMYLPVFTMAGSAAS